MNSILFLPHLECHFDFDNCQFGFQNCPNYLEKSTIDSHILWLNIFLRLSNHPPLSPINPPFPSGCHTSSPFGSTSFTGLSAQYTYGLNDGYFPLIGSTQPHTQIGAVVPRAKIRVPSLGILLFGRECVHRMPVGNALVHKVLAPREVVQMLDGVSSRVGNPRGTAEMVGVDTVAVGLDILIRQTH